MTAVQGFAQAIGWICLFGGSAVILTGRPVMVRAGLGAAGIGLLSLAAAG